MCKALIPVKMIHPQADVYTKGYRLNDKAISISLMDDLLPDCLMRRNVEDRCVSKVSTCMWAWQHLSLIEIDRRLGGWLTSNLRPKKRSSSRTSPWCMTVNPVSFFFFFLTQGVRSLPSRSQKSVAKSFYAEMVSSKSVMSFPGFLVSKSTNLVVPPLPRSSLFLNPTPNTQPTPTQTHPK